MRRVNALACWQSGATLLEILIGIVLASLVILLAGSGFVFVTRGWYGQQARLETQQNLRFAVERLVRELRLAGACLPQAGEVLQLLPIQGVNSGDRDELTFRTNRNCARSALRDTYRGAGPIRLDTVEGFVVGVQAFIWNPNTRTGQFFRIASVDNPERSITPDPATPVSGCYSGPDTPCDPSRGQPETGSSVYSVEVQRYLIEEDVSGVPELRLQLNPDLPGGVRELIARGIERLNIRYVLQRAYRTEECVARYRREGDQETEGLCVTDQPGEDEWVLVRAVQLEVGARSLRPVAGVGGDGFYRIRQGDFDLAPLLVRPRNVLHHGD